MSALHQLTIISTLPSVALGALPVLMLFGQNFAMVGMILLVGIVKTTAIMTVDYAL